MLLMRGTLLPDDELAVAVIGSRGPTVYGKQVAERFGEGLAQRGVTVVSGMARGIDAWAHRGALKAGGEDHRGLRERSGQGLSTGAQETDGGDSRPRGRGLRIPHGGGAEGRTLSYPEPDHRGTFPGGPGRGGKGGQRSVQHRELGTGAGQRLFRSARTRYVASLKGAEPANQAGGLPGGERGRGLRGAENFPQRENGRVRAQEEARMDLTEPEKRLVGLLTEAPLHVDLISEKSGMAVKEVLGILLGLEIKGIVNQQAGKVFAIA